MNSYTEEPTPEGIIYRFQSGHILETKVQNGAGIITFPAPEGCGPVTGSIRNYGDAFAALRKGEPIPQHCKTW